MVERFYGPLIGFEMLPGDRGEYVRYSDHEAELSALKKQVEELTKALEQSEAKLRRCQWFWPEHDTGENCCCDSAQEVVQNFYDWSSKNATKVVPVARGGIVEITYCAALPAADDTDSDDDFWVEEKTEEAAQTKLDAELARRAALASTKETSDAD